MTKSTLLFIFVFKTLLACYEQATVWEDLFFNSAEYFYQQTYVEDHHVVPPALTENDINDISVAIHKTLPRYGNQHECIKLSSPMKFHVYDHEADYSTCMSTDIRKVESVNIYKWQYGVEGGYARKHPIEELKIVFLMKNHKAFSNTLSVKRGVVKVQNALTWNTEGGTVWEDICFNSQKFFLQHLDQTVGKIEWNHGVLDTPNILIAVRKFQSSMYKNSLCSFENLVTARAIDHRATSSSDDGRKTELMSVYEMKCNNDRFYVRKHPIETLKLVIFMVDHQYINHEVDHRVLEVKEIVSWNTKDFGVPLLDTRI